MGSRLDAACKHPSNKVVLLASAHGSQPPNGEVLAKECDDWAWHGTTWHGLVQWARNSTGDHGHVHPWWGEGLDSHDYLKTAKLRGVRQMTLSTLCDCATPSCVACTADLLA